MSNAKKLHVRKGDKVRILSGNYKGKEGEVLEVQPSKYKAIVSGWNMVSKHVKPSAENPNGGIDKVEAPIHLSNLMVIDPATGQAARTGRQLNSDGKLERYFKTKK
ncbi:50S ribosomal protein L24 [Roseivirga sp.]|uniref:50S ribosomal protein L24 n=1 Tax=Roseivirga sp. TaxID=1964215 RepID=UPI003B8C13FD